MALAKFPPLYPILDAALLPEDAVLRREALAELIPNLAEAGVEILQYRNKQGGAEEILQDADTIRASAPASLKLILILNDYTHLLAEAGFHGVHLGQQDLSPREARLRLGPRLGSEAIIGLSTHNEVQLRAAALDPVDYIAIGPVFATSSKANPDPVVGLEGVRLARRLTSLPVIAIGGITLDHAARVWEAGADSIAVISAIFAAGVDPAKAAASFLHLFEELRSRLH